MPLNTNFPASPRSETSTIVQTNFDHLSDARRKPPKSDCVYRIGPAPREDIPNASENSADIGVLDSDMEEPPEERKYGKNKKQNRKHAGSRALIIYFAKMARKTNKELVDYRFLESLFIGGAEVNVADTHGQTVLHEVSRNWSTDLAKFFLDHNADINKPDKWGRTPLHLASAVNHYEMVQYLINEGANVHAQTTGELQTPIHYAAKYNAVGSLKVLIENKAKINDRDYKQRTPLFLAAEMAREDSALYLVEIGVPVGVFDDTGMTCIALMVEKMPHIAVEALNQFQVTDTAFRKDYFYLNYLEYNPSKWRLENTFVDDFGAPIVPDKAAIKKMKREKLTACPTTALKLAVQLQEFDVIMHPVMQQLIKQKWNLFGKWGAVIGASIHLSYILIWTLLAIFLPRNGVYYGEGTEWKIFLELLGVLLTLYFILKQIWESKITLREQRTFRLWRSRQLNRDMDYCHPRWPQEKTFLESEKKATRSGSGGLLSDPWNILDFITYISVLLVIVTRIVHMVMDDEEAHLKGLQMAAANTSTANSTNTSDPDFSKSNDAFHLRAYTAALIFMWLHFMKSCRPFTTLGPFITMLGHVMMDTITFAFLFFEFFIPYAIGFWILFGGYHNAAIMEGAGEESVDWNLFNDLLFAVWQVTLNVDFNFSALTSIDRLMAQVMVGTFFALSTVLCLNLYIALLSETFNRVYQNATANAALLQANTILQLEYTLTKKKHKRLVDYLQDECGPYVTQQAPDAAGVTEDELWDKTIRNILGRFDLLGDFLKEKFNIGATGGSGAAKNAPLENFSRKNHREQQETYDLYQKLLTRDRELFKITCDVYEVKCALLTYFGDQLPPPPKYIPPPTLDIHPPPKEQFFPQQPQKKQQPKRKVPKNQQQTKNNDIFRTIMENKAEEYEEESEEFLENEKELSGSWEDVPMMQFDNDTYDDEESEEETMA